ADVVIEGIVGTVHRKLRQATDVQHSPTGTPLGNEVQVLLKFHLGQDLRARLLFVAAHHFGVGVDAAVVVVAKQDVLGVLEVVVRRIVGREQYRIGVYHQVVHLCPAKQRAFILFEVGAQAHDQFRRVGQVNVHVRTQIV